MCVCLRVCVCVRARVEQLDPVTDFVQVSKLNRRKVLLEKAIAQAAAPPSSSTMTTAVKYILEASSDLSSVHCRSGAPVCMCKRTRPCVCVLPRVRSALDTVPESPLPPVLHAHALMCRCVYARVCVHVHVGGGHRWCGNQPVLFLAVAVVFWHGGVSVPRGWAWPLSSSSSSGPVDSDQIGILRWLCACRVVVGAAEGALFRVLAAAMQHRR